MDQKTDLIVCLFIVSLLKVVMILAWVWGLWASKGLSAPSTILGVFGFLGLELLSKSLWKRLG